MSDGDPGNSKYNVIFVLGGPGSGKGTQCTRIASEKKYDYIHLSAGELLRQERDTEGSLYGEEIQKHIVGGSIVPVAITCALLKKAMDTSGKHNFLIDGFPRNKDNLDGWCDAMHTVANVRFVLYFSCPKDVCVQRIMERSKTSGRTDDNESVLSKRFETYTKHTQAIIKHYEVAGLVREVDANRSEDAIVKDVFKHLDSL